MIYGHKSFRNVANVEISRNLFMGVSPIRIKYAPGVVDAAICKNRYIAPRSEHRGLSPYPTEAEAGVFQSDCGDPRLQKRR